MGVRWRAGWPDPTWDPWLCAALGGCPWSSCGDLRLAGPATRTLAGHDDTLDDELATPHAPRLAPLESAREALGTDGAGGAQRLGELDISRRLGEEELRVVRPARKLLVEALDLVERGELHVTSL